MQTISSQKSLARLLRQMIFIPCLHNRWLNAQTKNHLDDAIGSAERGHQGEICLIIENHLPIVRAYDTDTHARAVDLFGLHRVWDTQNNTGILIYLNICEHALHIVADRGINDSVNPATWQALCDEALAEFRRCEFETGLVALIDKVGQLLHNHYPTDVIDNELPNRPIYLK